MPLTAALVALLAITADAPAQTPAGDAAPSPDAVYEEPYPAGAPLDDYGLTAWCHGVLSEHMRLYTQVKPELDVISKRWGTLSQDERQQKAQLAAGKKTLTLFAQAMEAAERASPRPISVDGAAAVGKGRAMWAAANFADGRLMAYSWMNWGLPVRCETTAARLKSRSEVLGMALASNQAPQTPSALELAAAQPAPEAVVEPEAKAPAQDEALSTAVQDAAERP